MKRSPIRRRSYDPKRKRLQKKRHQNETPETRKAVYDREWCKCGRRGTQIHHTVPKRMGGTTHVYGEDELELKCDECHDKITRRL